MGTVSEHAYIAREPKCRHATLFIADVPQTKSTVAREIARAVRNGMTVERVPIEKARNALGVSIKFQHDSRTGKCSRRKVPA